MTTMNDPTLEYSVVGFLDILGFSAMVEKDSCSDEPKYLPVFLGVFEELAASVDKDGLDVKMFSDSIVIAAALEPRNVIGVIKVASALQRLFLKRRILLRGGVAFGKHFSNANIMFSQALVNAYLIESKIARFPRVVIDESVLNFAWHHNSTDDVLKQEIRDNVVKDRDGAMFVDYLTEATLGELTSHVQACIEGNTSPHETILEKMRWLFDYHNHCANSYTLQPLDVQNLVNGFSKIETIP
ncbi:hypothetical protein [Paraburkholderia sp. Cpub6]|uniref:hypothetical protein n=1 Tax=Paraburkholderia sp. Cpub6 TaxID=2723094 RepID=UPI00160941F3|nr:hypothetical protein [Paraburkholderia sp. Cpub6]MBB5463668.1 hypothetical protein [Paraburkholderia sp. Cpub6]